MSSNHFLSLADQSAEELRNYLDLARQIKLYPKAFQEACKGQTLAMIFQKPSLRTPTTATLGSPASEGGRGMDESQVAITLTRPFAIGTTEVSQALYRSLMGENPSLNVGDALPVERVSWTDAARLANALSAHHGLPDCYTIGVQVRWPEGLDCTGFRLSLIHI